MYEKSKAKSSKAITLVALVITIVVLIILAGVAINLTLSQNWIFNKAKEAREKTRIAQIKEDIGLELLNAQIEVNGANLSDEKVKEIVSKYGKLEDDKDTITTTEGYKISLSEIYKEKNGSTGDNEQENNSYKYVEIQADEFLVESISKDFSATYNLLDYVDSAKEIVAAYVIDPTVGFNYTQASWMGVNSNCSIDGLNITVNVTYGSGWGSKLSYKYKVLAIYK